ncbi:hypothetical protein BY458DRAFT_525039 [Sporodiniella umbellata]|nr:hypothetical protein BY458DRAFT_525039 [Sporodiniella umbellata]
MPPPKLSPIDLLYSEQELWNRLAIREFIFRFGHLYGLDGCTLGPLQNAQGDWRLQRLGGPLLWTCLRRVTTGVFDDLPKATVEGARALTRRWMDEHALDQIYDSTGEQQEAFLSILQQEGMTRDRWRDVARWIGCEGNEVATLLSVLELMLLEQDARQSFAGTKESHRQEFKEYSKEETKKKNQRQKLMNKMHQLQSLGKEWLSVKEELEAIETEIRDDCTRFHTRQLAHTRHAMKSSKRMQCAGQDRLGNMYWIFSDLLEQACRNSEPHWAFGIIVIGPGYGENQVRWWAVEGRKEMEKLSRWLKWHHDQDIKPLVDLIQQRIDYLYSLEWSVYGQGFFS